mgnify:CR=1 FL=1
MPSSLRKERDRQRKERTRQALLRAAQKVFARKGYHKTLVSDIVAAAGVGQGTFYRSFRDKRHVLQTLMEEFLSKLLAEFSEMEKHLPADAAEYRKASIDAFLRAAQVVGDEGAWATARAWFAAQPSVAAADIDAEGTIEIGFAGDDEAAAELLAAAIGAGLRIASFARAASDLEELFLQVTADGGPVETAGGAR